MKATKLQCPSCGADLEIFGNMTFCSYCGSKLVIDDGSININVNYTEKDEARIKESESKEKIRLEELKHKELSEKRSIAILIVVLSICIFFVFFSIGMSFYYDNASTPKENECAISSSAKQFKGTHYEQVIQELEYLGFSNIVTVEQNDLVIGLFTKEGEVEKISINGDTNFDEGDIFPNNAKIVITYHTFK